MSVHIKFTNYYHINKKHSLFRLCFNHIKSFFQQNDFFNCISDILKSRFDIAYVFVAPFLFPLVRCDNIP